MRHPLRADNPPVQSTTQRTDHNTSQPLITLPAASPHSQDSVRPSLGSSFGIFANVRCLERSNLTSCTSQISRGSPFHQHRQTPFGSLVHSDDCGFHSHFAPDRLMPQAQGIPQILWSKGRHTYLRAFPDIMRSFGADGKPFSFSLPRSSSDYPVYLEKLHSQDCLSSSPRACIPPSLTGIHWFQIRADNSFPTRYFCQSSLSTPGHPSRTRVPRVVVLWPAWK